MSYYGQKSDAPFYIGMLAFLSLGAGAIYGYTQGVFNREPQEIVQELTQFKRCDIQDRLFRRIDYDDDGEQYSYYVALPILECELTDKQKSTPDALAKAEEVKKDLVTEVWRLPSKIHNEVEVGLIEQNAKKFPEDTIESIVNNAKHFTNCDVVKVENNNAIKCSFSTVQMENEEVVETGRNSLAVMNIQVPQLNEQSINKLKLKIQKIKEENTALIQATSSNMTFKK